MFDEDIANLRPIVLHGGAIREGVYFLGLIVPGTNELFAIDHRVHGHASSFDEDEGDVRDCWAITHVPSMFRCQRHGYTDAETDREAMRMARGLFAEMTKRDWPLASTVGKDITERHQAMSDGEKTAFWEAVKGFELQRRDEHG